VTRYSKAPSATTVSSVSSLQEAIRDVLGGEYETFLQGSYKNDTSIRDLNDVDIVALRKQTVSGVFGTEHYNSSVTWNDIFVKIKDKLEGSARFKGKVSFGDKCVIVGGAYKADVVPAVRIGDYTNDPIAIFSFRAGAERLNYPRIHYENGVAKHESTGKTFKPIVRMFKKWATNYWPNEPIAPSFYIESLVSNVPDNRFESDLALGFFLVGYWIEQNVLPSLAPVVWSVAQDKDILVEDEWKRTDYSRFHAQLVRSTGSLSAALNANTVAFAVRNWRAAFNE
jgi:hypothetical protein